MAINANIPGNPAAVFELADWLDKLYNAVNSGAVGAQRASGESSFFWVGHSGDAFRNFSDDLTRASLEIAGRLNVIRDKVRCYAQQLQWRQEDMAVHRDTAASGGLLSCGLVIYPPKEVPKPGVQITQAGSPGEAKAQAEVAAYLHYTDLLATYEKVAGEVRATFDQLDNWIADNLVQMEAGALAPPSIIDLTGMLEDIAGGMAENAFAKTADLLRSRIPEAAETLARLRSGNPEVRSGAKAPREIALIRAMKPGTPAGELAKWGGYLDNAAKLAARSGTLIGIGLSVYSISQGASPSSVAVGFGAGMAVTAAAAGLTLAAPEIATVAIVGAAAAAAGWGASTAYENLVPQSTREEFDEGIQDAWNAVGKVFA